MISKPSVLVVVYLFLSIPSVIFSQNLSLSISKFLITFAYGSAVAQLLSLPLSTVNVSNIFKLAKAALLVSGMLVISNCLSFSYSNTNRFSFGSDLNFIYSNSSLEVDPNMTAMGIVLLFAFCVPYMLKSSNSFYSYLSPFLLTLLTLFSISMLASRTAIVSFLVIVLVFLFSNNKRKQKNLIMVIFLIAFILAACATDFGAAAMRFDPSIMIHEANLESGRFSLYKDSFDKFNNNIANYFIGIGYANTNPHNDYLRIFFDSGVFVGILNIYLLFYIHSTSRSRAIANFGSPFLVDAVAFPFYFMLLTYGHTKTYWLGIAFIWLASTPKTRTQ